MPEFKDRTEYEYFLRLTDQDEEEIYIDLSAAPVTADGCRVAPDGTCPHGYRSPLLLLGLI